MEKKIELDSVKTTKFQACNSKIRFKKCPITVIIGCRHDLQLYVHLELDFYSYFFCQLFSLLVLFVFSHTKSAHRYPRSFSNQKKALYFLKKAAQLMFFRLFTRKIVFTTVLNHTCAEPFL